MNLELDDITILCYLTELSNCDHMSTLVEYISDEVYIRLCEDLYLEGIDMYNGDMFDS